jgi:hypothetical protein
VPEKASLNEPRTKYTNSYIFRFFCQTDNGGFSSVFVYVLRGCSQHYNVSDFFCFRQLKKLGYFTQWKLWDFGTGVEGKIMDAICHQNVWQATCARVP